MIQEFLPHGPLRDGDLQLRALSLNPTDPPTYRFGMFVDRRPVGSIDLRLGEDELGGQIGYGVHPSHRGQGLAERSLRLLLPLARRHGFEHLWITCDPDNLASRRTCEKAGAVLQEIVDIPTHHEMYARGHRQKCRFRLAL